MLREIIRPLFGFGIVDVLCDADFCLTNNPAAIELRQLLTIEDCELMQDERNNPS